MVSKLSLFFINIKYNAGTTNSDKNVDTINPDIIVQASGGHKVLLVTTNGNNLSFTSFYHLW